MSVKRTRSNSSTCAGGYALWGPEMERRAFDPVIYSQQEISDWTEKHIDERGLLPTSSCTISKVTKFWTPLSYKRSIPGPVLNSYVGRISTRAGTNFASHISSTGKPNNDILALELLERTSPFRPEYSVPVAIAELLDAVSLLKFAGSSLINQLSGNYLNLKFGYEQLFKDIATLSGILKEVESRVKEFDSLIQHGGLHRRVALWSGSKSESGRVIEDSYGSLLTNSDETKLTRQKVYGSVRWFPKVELLPPPDALYAFNRALGVVLDLNPNTISWDTLWNSLPFTWLIDYFTNLGTVLNASKGRQIVVPRYITISVKTVTVVRAKPYSRPAGVSGGGYRIIRESLTRDTYPDNYKVSDITFNGLLSADRWKTLLALIGSFQKRL